MTARIVTWQPDTEPLGSAVVAIGVFDGVHLGHQALLADTVLDAAAHGVRSVAVTFDRDPDQVVSPATAAPQLLTLDAKLHEMGLTGIDVVLVVPFTEQIAAMAPESFLDDVLLRALTPVSVHVGNDFRFGRMATGDVSTLRQAGLRCDFAILPHDLVSVDGAPVTSTRIRALIGAGDIAQATRLLGRYPQVSGRVHRGRGEGASIGYPTANVVAVHFAALPSPGVYAGRAALPDGSKWASAISVGRPPMFPQATDVLEAHLIQFEGDLYDQPITLEIWDRLRDQQPFPSVEVLTSAIANDVERALDIAGFTDEELAEQPDPAADETPADPRAQDPWGLFAADPALDSLATDDADIVDDPAALEAAENAVRDVKVDMGFETLLSFGAEAADEVDPGWCVLAKGLAPDRETLLVLDSMLFGAGIPAAWEPFRPDERPRWGTSADSLLRLSVPAEQLDVARAIFRDWSTTTASAQRNS